MRLTVIASPLLILSSSATSAGPYVVLTNLPPGADYLRAIEVLRESRDVAAVVRFQESDPSTALGELKALQPTHVAVVLEPQAIDANLVRRLFELSTKMDDDPQVDFAYGFITGATADDAVQLARNAQQAEAQAAELAKRFFGLAETSPNTGKPPPGSTAKRRPSDSLARLMATYAECFRRDGWRCTVREWPGRLDDAWTEEKPDVLAAMSGSRMVFLAGHGGPSAA